MTLVTVNPYRASFKAGEQYVLLLNFISSLTLSQLDHEDLSFHQEIYNGPGYRMHLGQIRQSGRVVSVKVYRGSHAKKVSPRSTTPMVA